MRNELDIPFSWDGSATLAVGLFALALVAIPGLVAWHRARLDHEEWARALEMGYLIPRRSSRWPQAFFCAMLGAGVPIATFVIAWLVSSGDNPRREVWIVAIVVSGVAILGATIVAAIGFGRAEPSSRPEKLTADPAKPAVDPDALDFAGRLGRG